MSLQLSVCIVRVRARYLPQIGQEREREQERGERESGREAVEQGRQLTSWASEKEIAAINAN